MPERTPEDPSAPGNGASRGASGAAAAEKAAALGHAPVPPDGSAAYGEHPDQVIDFFTPRGARNGAGGPAPLVVLLHGGAWRQAYDRAHVSPLAAHLAGHGLVVASVEYRRGGDRPGHAGRWPETLDDVAAAVDTVAGLAAATLGEDAVDPRRTVLTGHSAGGHLALWAAARHMLPSDSPWHRPSPPPLRGVVALAPIADLTSALALGVCSDAVTQFLGGPEHTGARQQDADPAALLPTGTATTIVHGTTDNVVPPRVAEAFVTASGKAGEEAQLTMLDGVGHFPLIDPATGAAAVVAEEIAQLAW
jgi:acetyl esterase/lipase